MASLTPTPTSPPPAGAPLSYLAPMLIPTSPNSGPLSPLTPSQQRRSSHAWVRQQVSAPVALAPEDPVARALSYALSLKTLDGRASVSAAGPQASPTRASMRLSINGKRSSMSMGGGMGGERSQFVQMMEAQLAKAEREIAARRGRGGGGEEKQDALSAPTVIVSPTDRPASPPPPDPFASAVRLLDPASCLSPSSSLHPRRSHRFEIPLLPLTEEKEDEDDRYWREAMQQPQTQGGGGATAGTAVEAGEKPHRTLAVQVQSMGAEITVTPTTTEKGTHKRSSSGSGNFLTVDGATKSRPSSPSSSPGGDTKPRSRVSSAQRRPSLLAPVPAKTAQPLLGFSPPTPTRSPSRRPSRSRSPASSRPGTPESDQLHRSSSFLNPSPLSQSQSQSRTIMGENGFARGVVSAATAGSAASAMAASEGGAQSRPRSARTLGVSSSSPKHTPRGGVIPRARSPSSRTHTSSNASSSSHALAVDVSAPSPPQQRRRTRDPSELVAHAPPEKLDDSALRSALLALDAAYATAAGERAAEPGLGTTAAMAAATGAGTRARAGDEASQAAGAGASAAAGAGASKGTVVSVRYSPMQVVPDWLKEREDFRNYFGGGGGGGGGGGSGGAGQKGEATSPVKGKGQRAKGKQTKARPHGSASTPSSALESLAASPASASPSISNRMATAGGGLNSAGASGAGPGTGPNVHVSSHLAASVSHPSPSSALELLALHAAEKPPSARTPADVALISALLRGGAHGAAVTPSNTYFARLPPVLLEGMAAQVSLERAQRGEVLFTRIQGSKFQYILAAGGGAGAGAGGGGGGSGGGEGGSTPPAGASAPRGVVVACSSSTGDEFLSLRAHSHNLLLEVAAREARAREAAREEVARLQREAAEAERARWEALTEEQKRDERDMERARAMQAKFAKLQQAKSAAGAGAGAGDKGKSNSASPAPAAARALPSATASPAPPAGRTLSRQPSAHALPSSPSVAPAASPASALPPVSSSSPNLSRRPKHLQVLDAADLNRTTSPSGAVGSGPGSELLQSMGELRGFEIGFANASIWSGNKRSASASATGGAAAAAGAGVTATVPPGRGGSATMLSPGASALDSAAPLSARLNPSWSSKAPSPTSSPPGLPRRISRPSSNSSTAASTASSSSSANESVASCGMLFHRLLPVGSLFGHCDRFESAMQMVQSAGGGTGGGGGGGVGAGGSAGGGGAGSERAQQLRSFQMRLGKILSASREKEGPNGSKRAPQSRGWIALRTLVHVMITSRDRAPLDSVVALAPCMLFTWSHQSLLDLLDRWETAERKRVLQALAPFRQGGSPHALLDGWSASATEQLLQGSVMREYSGGQRVVQQGVVGRPRWDPKTGKVRSAKEMFEEKCAQQAAAAAAAAAAAGPASLLLQQPLVQHHPLPPHNPDNPSLFLLLRGMLQLTKKCEVVQSVRWPCGSNRWEVRRTVQTRKFFAGFVEATSGSGSGSGAGGVIIGGECILGLAERDFTVSVPPGQSATLLLVPRSHFDLFRTQHPRSMDVIRAAVERLRELGGRTIAEAIEARNRQVEAMLSAAGGVGGSGGAAAGVASRALSLSACSNPLSFVSRAESTRHTGQRSASQYLEQILRNNNEGERSAAAQAALLTHVQGMGTQGAIEEEEEEGAASGGLERRESGGKADGCSKRSKRLSSSSSFAHSTSSAVESALSRRASTVAAAAAGRDVMSPKRAGAAVAGPGSGTGAFGTPPVRPATQTRLDQLIRMGNQQREAEEAMENERERERERAVRENQRTASTDSNSTMSSTSTLSLSPFPSASAPPTYSGYRSPSMDSEDALAPHHASTAAATAATSAAATSSPHRFPQPSMGHSVSSASLGRSAAASQRQQRDISNTINKLPSRRGGGAQQQQQQPQQQRGMHGSKSASSLLSASSSSSSSLHASSQSPLRHSPSSTALLPSILSSSPGSSASRERLTTSPSVSSFHRTDRAARERWESREASAHASAMQRARSPSFTPAPCYDSHHHSFTQSLNASFRSYEHRQRKEQVRREREFAELVHRMNVELQERVRRFEEAQAQQQRVGTAGMECVEEEGEGGGVDAAEEAELVRKAKRMWAQKEAVEKDSITSRGKLLTPVRQPRTLHGASPARTHNRTASSYLSPTPGSAGAASTGSSSAALPFPLLSSSELASLGLPIPPHAPLRPLDDLTDVTQAIWASHCQWMTDVQAARIVEGTAAAAGTAEGEGGASSSTTSASFPEPDFLASAAPLPPHLAPSASLTPADLSALSATLLSPSPVTQIGREAEHAGGMLHQGSRAASLASLHPPPPLPPHVSPLSASHSLLSLHAHAHAGPSAPVPFNPALHMSLHATSEPPMADAMGVVPPVAAAEGGAKAPGSRSHPEASRSTVVSTNSGLYSDGEQVGNAVQLFFAPLPPPPQASGEKSILLP